MTQTGEKRRTGLGGKAADAFREKLLEHKAEILDLYQHDLKVGQQAQDEGTDDLVDRANNAYSREFMLHLSGQERDTLIRIEGALRRLDAGSFGVCELCGEKIGRLRLEAIPWADLCIDCQEKDEKGLLDG